MRVTLSILLSFMISLSGNGQSPAEYIYGVVTTHSGDEYEGFMRWGKEEVFWHDLFNGEKISSKSGKVNYTDRSSSRWSNFDWSFSSLWDDKYKTTSHTFACYYGDIKSLHLGKESKVDLELKNGAFIKLEGGSNDIGTSIYLEDYELGVIKFAWSKIERIDFYQAPAGITPNYGDALYGLVKTRKKGNFEGYIKWDKDERTTTDILDGESRLGTQKIPFDKIKKIIKRGSSGSDLVFDSGRTLYVDDSNDVDAGNRGIRVSIEGIGVVDVDWEEFQEIEFYTPPVNGPAYSDFNKPTGLQAEVATYDHNNSGLIIFDIDEMWEIEVLDGEDDHYIKYYIPFRNISKIEPKNRDYSLVHLKNGESLLLGDTHDVSSANDGIIIHKNNSSKPTYVDWDDIDFIKFK